MPRENVEKARLALLLCSLALLLASTPALADGNEASRPPSFEPRLHPVVNACGKKWAKRARALSKDQLAWMLRKEHALYRVAVKGRLLMTLELLSTPSFRDCDIRSHWGKRETSIRVIYFRTDGSERIVLRNFAHDHIFFNGKPQFFPHLGKALLKGITVDGRQANRWMELTPLKELYAEAAAGEAPASLAALLDHP